MRPVIHITVFLAGLLSAAWGIRAIDALPYWSWRREKLGHLSRADAGYDTMFVGSSRVHYGFRPDVFDDRMTELGHTVRSFNAGFSGDKPCEFSDTVDWVLSNSPGRYQTVFVELHAWNLPFPEANWMTNPVVETHSLTVLQDRLEASWVARSSFGSLIQDWNRQVLHTLVNLLRVGQGTRIFTEWIRSPETAAQVRERGWKASEDQQSENARRVREEFAAKIRDERQAANLKKRRSTEVVSPELRGGFHLEGARRVARRIERYGAAPVFFVMPTFSLYFRGRDGVAELAREYPVLELDSGVAFPELYEFDGWDDETHLNTEGAKRFSRLLAEQFAKLQSKR